MKILLEGVARRQGKVRAVGIRRRQPTALLGLMRAKIYRGTQRKATETNTLSDVALPEVPVTKNERRASLERPRIFAN